VAAGREGVYAVDLANGRLAWRLPRDGGPLGAEPAVVSSDGREVLLFTEGDRARRSRLRAYDLRSRKTLWDVSLEDVSSSGVSVDGDTAFVGDRSGTLYAVDVRSGRVRWKFRGGGVIDAPVAAARGRVYVVTANRSTNEVDLVSVSENNGKSEWTFSPVQLATFGTSAAVAGESVYIGLGDRTVYSADVRTGTEQWSAQVASAFSPIAGTATRGDLVVAVGTFPLSAGAGMYGFDARTGARRWWFQFDSPALLSSPVIAGRDVLVGLNDGRLVAVDTSTGHEVWEGRTGAGTLGPVALAGDMVVVSKAGSRGGLVAFRSDPSDHLIDVTSRTKLDLAVSLRNYAVTFVAVAGGVLLLGRLARAFLRGGTAEEGPHTEGEPT
jgi:outer membrane protein assembly factor BamB